MKNLLLAFLFIGFITTSSFATTAIVKTTSEVAFCEDGKKCTKKDCKHNKKECKTSKKECTKGDKKACCSKEAKAKKSCCAGSKAKTCSKSKAANSKEESKETK